uniref:Uncharacterized protein n=1 Tax=Solanum tuberosum TaxID=4113 RepID=M1DTG7_SOLTU
MARPKVTGWNRPPQKRARGIVINKEAAAARAMVSKPPPERGKDKVKGPVQPTLMEESFDSEGVYATHLTSSESEGHSEGSSPASFSEPKDDHLLQARKAELRSKSMNDPSRISVPPLPLQPPALA